jgi:hypothetical protein
MYKLTLRDFLKKYSTLSNEFINDFYNIYDHNNSNNSDFIVNLDLVAKWLETRKRKIKRNIN